MSITAERDACTRLGERAEAAVLPRRDYHGARLRETNVEASYVLVIHGVRWQSDFRVL